MKWYSLPDNQAVGRWLLFTVYAGTFHGVHLLDIPVSSCPGTFLLLQEYEIIYGRDHGFAAGAGALAIVFVQSLIIVGIPSCGGDGTDHGQ